MDTIKRDDIARLSIGALCPACKAGHLGRHCAGNERCGWLMMCRCGARFDPTTGRYHA